MITNLPTDLQHAVFDKLPAADRVKLNMAMPKHQKIRKTCTTDDIKTKKIGVIAHALKRRPPKEISCQLMSFIKENRNDPTIKELVGTPGIHRNILEDVEEDCFETNKGRLLKALKEKNMSSLPDMSAIVLIEHSSFVCDLVEHLGKCCTPAMFDTLVTHEKTSKMMDNLFVARDLSNSF